MATALAGQFSAGTGPLGQSFSLRITPHFTKKPKQPPHYQREKKSKEALSSRFFHQKLRFKELPLLIPESSKRLSLPKARSRNRYLNPHPPHPAPKTNLPN